MTSAFDWVVGFIVIQTVVALLALAWAVYSGQFRDLERKGRRVFFEDMESDSEIGGEENG